MVKTIYKYIYGPVSSWRLGSSLGIDPVSKGAKVCTFDCIYCQAGKTVRLAKKREVFTPAGEILKELDSLPTLEIDYITFSGAGEPTLAKNLASIIKAIRRRSKHKVAILTNASFLTDPAVQKDLMLADLVIAKLDAPSQAVFEKVNRPVRGLRLEKIIEALKEFRSKYKGRFALQIMFTKENQRYAKDIAGIAKDIAPGEVQINTPLRPCKVKPLSRGRIDRIKGYFKGLKIISVYDVRKKKVSPIDRIGTLRRRGEI